MKDFSIYINMNMKGKTFSKLPKKSQQIKYFLSNKILSLKNKNKQNFSVLCRKYFT